MSFHPQTHKYLCIIFAVKGLANSSCIVNNDTKTTYWIGKLLGKVRLMSSVEIIANGSFIIIKIDVIYVKFINVFACDKYTLEGHSNKELA